MRKRITCDKCNYKSTSEDAVKMHIKLMHQKMQKTRKTIPKELIATNVIKKTYNNHKHKVHEAKYQCDQCDQKFKRKTSLKDHIKMRKIKTN